LSKENRLIVGGFSILGMMFVFNQGDRVIVPMRGQIINRYTKQEMELLRKKRFDIEIELPDEENIVVTKEYDTEEIQCYDCEINLELRSLADKIINRFPELSHIDEFIGRENICYVLSYEPKGDKGKTVFGDCRAVKGSFRALMDYRYIITFYEPNIQDFTENQKKILMLHELKHIQEDGKVRLHDVEDFASILHRYGIDWNNYRQEVPDILAGGDSDKETKGNKLEAELKANSISRSPSKSRRQKDKNR
jgi:predicted metallopeptidase